MSKTIDAWQPVKFYDSEDSDVRLVPGTTDQYEKKYNLHTGPTPKKGENGQLELLLRSLKRARETQS